MAVSTLGMRVVRGPDWRWSAQDGGDGGLGTVVEVGGKSDSSSPAETVVIQWDLGSKTNYRSGYESMHDLRVWDTASSGAQHFGVKCDGCEEEDFFGIRWTCHDCGNFDLCNRCYHGDVHSLDHRFHVIPSPGAAIMEVDPRNGAEVVMSKGIFAGAKISRGLDWQWGDQDGGSTNLGVVEDLRNWECESGRSVAHVRWPTGQRNVYRVGHAGKVDIKCIEAAEGGNFYRDHLPLLVGKNFALEGSEKHLKVGSLVQVAGIEFDIWKMMQDGHGGWNDSMEKVVRQVGEVIFVDYESGDVTVNYRKLGCKFRFHSAVVEKVPRLRSGDQIQMIEDVGAMKAMLIGHGEWTDGMFSFMGKIGEAISQGPDFDVRVKYGSQVWLFHPGCLVKIGGDPDTPPHTTFGTPTSAFGDEDGVDSADVGLPVISNVDAAVNVGTGDVTSVSRNSTNIPDRNTTVAHTADGNMQDFLATLLAGVAPAATLAKAIQGGQLAEARTALELNKDHVNSSVGEHNQKCIHIAAGLGLVSMLELLYDFGASLDAVDKDGDTAMHFAVHGDEPRCIELLHRLGGDVNARNSFFATPLHTACLRGYDSAAAELLRLKADVNAQDSEGDTPLHDAVTHDMSGCTELLLAAGASTTLLNYKGFDVIQYGALRGSHFSLEMIMDKAPELVNSPKDDGFTPLHLAAFNNHVSVATVLLRQPACKVDAVNSDKRTPLMMAVLKGYTGCTELLVSYGADLESEDHEGDTVLHMALFRQTMADIARMQSGEPGCTPSPVLDQIRSKMGFHSDDDNKSAAIACFLAQEGCSLTYRNHNGKTPLDMCVDPQVRKLVESYAKPKGWSSFHGSNVVGGTHAHLKMDRGTKPSRPPPGSDAKLMSVVVTEELPDCILCENKANIRIVPCGHNILCDECTKRALKCPEKICKATITGLILLVPASTIVPQPADDSKDGDEADVCMLCDKKASVVFEPCGHVAVCRDCCDRTRKCMVCKALVTRMTYNGQVVSSSTSTAISTASSGGGPSSGVAGVEDTTICPICFDDPKQVAFLCGHRTCSGCSDKIYDCPICRKPITHRIKLWD